MNYIIKKNQKLIVNINGLDRSLTTKIDHFFNELLINELTDVQGRINAVKDKYQYNKLVPIYINDDICFIPIYPKDDAYNIYINIKHIAIVKKVQQKTLIVFLDQSVILLNKKRDILMKHIKRAEKITK